MVYLMKFDPKQWAWRIGLERPFRKRNTIDPHVQLYLPARKHGTCWKRGRVVDIYSPSRFFVNATNENVYERIKNEHGGTRQGRNYRWYRQEFSLFNPSLHASWCNLENYGRASVG